MEMSKMVDGIYSTPEEALKQEYDNCVVLSGIHHASSNSPDCRINKFLRFMRNYTGRVNYISIDYLLPYIALNKTRYGVLTKDYPDDFMVKDKDWRFVYHTNWRHFLTEGMKQKLDSIIGSNRFISAPLNMCVLQKRKEWLPPAKDPKGFIYFGAYRKKRIDKFKQYFSGETPLDWTISTPNKEDFLKITNGTVIGPVAGSLNTFLNGSVANLILSDNTENPYTPLPTRFWEGVNAGVPAVFDEDCDDMLGDDGAESRLRVNGKKSLVKTLDMLSSNKKMRLTRVERDRSLAHDFEDEIESVWKMDKWIYR
jgi:hypothetical protein